MVISNKGLATSLNISIIRSSKNKQNTRTSITDIVPQDFMKLLEEFKDLPYLGYRKKQVKSEPMEAYLSLVKNNFHIINSKKHALPRNQIIKSINFNKKHVNKEINYGIASTNKIKLERAKETRT